MKTIKLLTIILVAASLATSCKLGKRYTRPKLDLPARLEAQATDSATIADVPWEQFYTDSLLRQLIESTLENNKDMLIAAARVKELAALKRIDLANLFPNVTLRAYAEKEQDNYGGNNADDNNQFDLKANISWELDLWGRLRWAKDESTAEFLGSVENQRALQMSLVASVAEAYFELVALDNELKIIRQTVEARRQGVELAQIRYQGGVTSEMTYSQAKVELASAEALVPDLEQEITLKENEIAFLAGKFPFDISRASQPEDVQAGALPVGLPSTLLTRRPDVRRAEQQLIAANARVGIAYTNMFPQIRLTAQLGAESEQLSDLLKSPFHLISGTLLQPVLGLWQNKARHKAAQAAYEQAVLGYEKAVLNAFMDAYNAIVQYNKTQEIYQSSYSLERSSRRNLDLAQLQYMNGVIAYLDLLDAQRTYLSAQIRLSNATRDKQLAAVNLYKALGGGWQQ